MTKDKLLALLMDAEDYLSGEALSEQLGVSRTAIWKAVKSLKEEGFDISSVRNRGYLIQETSSELTESAVKSHLSPESCIKQVKVYDTIDSTNTEGKRLYQAGLRQAALIVAKEQTKGKGRRGRTWASPKDEGIFMSLLLMPDIDPTQASMLTLVAGLAVCQAIEALMAIKPMIKWPNDIVVEGRKVGGILTEMSAEMDYVHHVIVGMGINANQSTFHESIVDMAVSLKQICGQPVNRPALIGRITEHFEALYNRFIEEGDLSFMTKAYNERCINVGAQLKVISRQGDTLGTGLGICPSGTLQIRQADGTITEVNAGEVSVRGLYGYV